VCRDKSVEDGIVEDAKARVFVSQVVVDRLIVVVEDERAASNDDSLRWLGHCQRVDLVETAVQRLCRRVGAHIPNTDHARDVRRDNLLGATDPLNADQTMVVAFHQKHSWFDLGVPHEDVVVETS